MSTTPSNRLSTWFVLSALVLGVLAALLVKWAMTGPDPGQDPSLPVNGQAEYAGPSAVEQPADGLATELGVDAPLPDLPGKRQVDAMVRIPPSKFHQQRVETISEESARELVENLANFDDMHLAVTSSSSPLSNGSYEGAAHRVANLFRVRKLLSLEQAHPGMLDDFLVQGYQQSIASWPGAYADWNERFYGPPEGLTSYEPMLIDRAEAAGIVSTYLMGEVGSVTHLKLLYDGYQTHQEWLGTYKRAARSQAPVPPMFSLYAMHRLMTNLPEGSLDPDARPTRAAYLAWAEQNVPKPEMKEVVAWDAQRFEGDPLQQVADPQGVLLADQPKMSLAVYPSAFADGTSMDHNVINANDLSDQAQAWRDTLFTAVREITGR